MSRYWYTGIEKAVLRKVLKRVGLLASATTVSLLFATASGDSHVAVWMGASTHDASSWLQAGIEKSPGEPPQEYIEVGRRHKQISLRTWPTQFGHRAHIRLLNRGNLWKIQIDKHVSRWTYLPGAQISTLKLLEVYRNGGFARGTATIGNRKITGP